MAAACAPSRGCEEGRRTEDGAAASGDAAEEEEEEACRSLSDGELLRRIAVVALPAYPMAAIGRCVGLTSSALIGRLGSTEALAAVGLSSVITNITGYSWLWGLSAAVSTLSAQSWGARSYHAVGVTMQRGFLVLLCFAAAPLVALWLASEHILVATGQDLEVARLVGLYTRIRAPGILFECANAVVSRTLGSMSILKLNIVVSAVVMATNVGLSFLLIPRIGFVGAPLTVLLCDVLQATLLCTLAWRNPDFRRCWPGLTRKAFKEWWPFLKISCPSLLLLGIEWWTWDLQSFLAGLISPLAQATQAVTPQITDLQYSAGQALNTAATTVVGNLLGEGRRAAARRTAGLVMKAVFVVMALQALLFIALQSHLPYLFTKDEAIIANIRQLLPKTLAFSFLDGQQCALCGILCGVGRQALAAPLIFACYWLVGVPLGVALAFGALGGEKQGLSGLWTGMLVAVVLHVVSFGVAVLRLNWPRIAREVRERTEREHLAEAATGGAAGGAAATAAGAELGTGFLSAQG